MSLRFSIFALSLTMIVLHCTPTHACGAANCFGIFPEDGTTGVPTNALVAIGADDLASMAVLSQYGAAEDPIPYTVDAMFGMAVIKPVNSLKPSTTYSLSFGEYSGSGLGVCVKEKNGSISGGKEISFTTGIGEDHSPPVFRGATKASVEFQPATVFGGGPCETAPDRVSYTVEGDDVPDATFYILYLDGEAVELGAYAYIRYEEPGELSLHNIYPKRCFVMRAMDQAGNIDSNNVEICADRGPTIDSAPGAGGCGCSLIEIEN